MANETTTEKFIDSQAKKVPGFLSDFMVEFLGAFLPGVLFLTLLAFSFFPLIAALIYALCEDLTSFRLSGAITFMMNSIQSTPYMFWLGVYVIFFSLAYFLGHLFFRQGPKDPDQKSFDQILEKECRKKTDDDYMNFCKECLYQTKKDSDDIKAWLQNNKHTCKISGQKGLEGVKKAYSVIHFGCTDTDDCAFPYAHIDKYLEWRGHDHLLSLVGWAGDSRKRSKAFINLLKIRLQYYVPEKYKPLVRIEAHVRLSTSVWYVSKVLQRTLFMLVPPFILTIPGILYFKTVARMGMESWSFWLWPIAGYLSTAVLPSILTLILSRYILRVAQRFIHYQRIREVFHVLELAYTALESFPDMLRLRKYNKDEIYSIVERDHRVPIGKTVDIGKTACLLENITKKGCCLTVGGTTPDLLSELIRNPAISFNNGINDDYTINNNEIVWVMRQKTGNNDYKIGVKFGQELDDVCWSKLSGN